MCKLCDNYNFGCIGFRKWDEHPSIYFPGIIGNVPKGEKFKFCPACGKELTEENYKKGEIDK